MDDFDQLTKKPLKLSSGGEKKKNKKLVTPRRDEIITRVPNESNIIVTTATKAEKAFKSKQEKIAEGRILKKALKTHKQRVEEFNKHLDSLSEHYDIPKVSWTK